LADSVNPAWQQIKKHPDYINQDAKLFLKTVGGINELLRLLFLWHN
jgi:hypothetical protein